MLTQPELNLTEILVGFEELDPLFKYLLTHRQDLIQGKANWLDIGCEDGKLQRLGKKYFPEWQFTGVDIDYGILQHARRLSSPELSFMHVSQDPTELPFADDSFDIVTAMAIYDYCADDSLPGQYAEEVVRVTKDKGIYSCWDGRIDRIDFDAAHNELITILQQHGFCIIHNSTDYLYQSLLVKNP